MGHSRQEQFNQTSSWTVGGRSIGWLWQGDRVNVSQWQIHWCGENHGAHPVQDGRSANNFHNVRLYHIIRIRGYCYGIHYALPGWHQSTTLHSVTLVDQFDWLICGTVWYNQQYLVGETDPFLSQIFSNRLKQISLQQWVNFICHQLWGSGITVVFKNLEVSLLVEVSRNCGDFCWGQQDQPPFYDKGDKNMSECIVCGYGRGNFLDPVNAVGLDQIWLWWWQLKASSVSLAVKAFGTLQGS